MFRINDINTYSFIYFGGERVYIEDKEIATLLDITLEEYIQLAQTFNASLKKGVIFYNYNDAKNFSNYLNEKYILILKLSGKI